MREAVGAPFGWEMPDDGGGYSAYGKLMPAAALVA